MSPLGSSLMVSASGIGCRGLSVAYSCHHYGHRLRQLSKRHSTTVARTRFGRTQHLATRAYHPTSWLSLFHMHATLARFSHITQTHRLLCMEIEIQVHSVCINVRAAMLFCLLIRTAHAVHPAKAASTASSASPRALSPSHSLAVLCATLDPIVAKCCSC